MLTKNISGTIRRQSAGPKFKSSGSQAKYEFVLCYRRKLCVTLNRTEITSGLLSNAANSQCIAAAILTF